MRGATSEHEIGVMVCVCVRALRVCVRACAFVCAFVLAPKQQQPSGQVRSGQVRSGHRSEVRSRRVGGRVTVF